MSEDQPKINVLPEVPKSVDNAIENLTDLPTKGIGQTFADCWYLAFGGISQLAEKRRIKYAIELENFKNELENSLSTVPEERKIEPTTQIVLKTLDEAKYCVEEEELRKLFVNLLTSCTDSLKNVHPSFAQIIGQMSSNDAKMLQTFKVANIQPICNIKAVSKEDDSFNIVARNLFMAGPSNMKLNEKSISISSLVHLGLLEIPEDAHFTDDSFYSGFDETDIFQNNIVHFPDKEIRLQKKIVQTTSLGELFISCCLP